MIEAILLATSLLFCQTQAYQGDDMDDDDFAAFVNAHTQFVDKYGESAAKGCVNGAIGGSPGGFQALCIGCATGAAGNVVQDFIFKPRRSEDR